MGKSIAIRVDVGGKVGTGHWMRDQTIATAMRLRGHEVVFFARHHDSSNPTPPSAHPVVWLTAATESIPVRHEDAPAGMMHPEFLPVSASQDVADFLAAMKNNRFCADLLICDHYGLSSAWYAAARPWFPRIATIDDLADRKIDTDLLLDQNFYADLDTRYEGLVPPGVRTLLGPRYALLRQSFASGRESLRRHWDGGETHRIVLSFGGRELRDCNLRVAKCLLARTDAHIKVLGAPDDRNSGQWRELMEQYPDRLSGPEYCVDPVPVFRDATAYVGAGGSVTWERCALGLPGIVYSIAENQKKMSLETAAAGYQIYLGDFASFTEDPLAGALEQLSRPDFYHAMVDRMMDLVDGMGSGRVADELERLMTS